MQDNSKVGCAGIVALVLAAYFVWIAILYAGIPLAAGGGIAAFQISQKARGDESLTKRERTKKIDLSIGLYFCAALLFIISVAGNVLSEKSPLKRLMGIEEESSEDEEYSKNTARKKVSVTQEECNILRQEPQYYPEIKSMCYRMYPTDSWGDSAGRAVCETNERDRIEACGVDLILTY